MQQTTVLLLFGGESSEHEVSISSAHNVFAALDDAKYDISLGFIDTSGKWWLVDAVEQPMDITGAPQLIPLLGTKSFMTLPSTTIIYPTVILPVLHGEHGEDGSVQGLADLLHIPIVGAGIVGSVLGIDKDLTKQLLTQADIPIIPYLVHRKGMTPPDFSEVTQKLGTPLFIKPAHLGSSVGVTKVYDEAGYKAALQAALVLDTKILIEQCVVGRELEVAVLGNPPNFRVSGIGEVQPEDEFYTYEAKYSITSHTKVIVPAHIPDVIAEQVKAMTRQVFHVLEGRGLARIDFFYNEETQEVFVNEINTLPGFTNMSMYPKLWREAGIGYSELIDTLIDLAR